LLSILQIKDKLKEKRIKSDKIEIELVCSLFLTNLKLKKPQKASLNWYSKHIDACYCYSYLIGSS